MSLHKWWSTFADEPRDRADVRAGAYLLARAFGSPTARYTPDYKFSEGLEEYAFEDSNGSYAPTPDWVRGIDAARARGALADAWRDDYVSQRALWLDDFADFEALEGSADERASAMRVFGRLGIEPLNLRPLASASGRLRAPSRYWRKRAGLEVTDPWDGEYNETFDVAAPGWESGRRQLLEWATNEAPAVGSDVLAALDDLARHLRETIVVFGLTSGLPSELLAPTDRIVGVRRDGTPIVRVTADESTWFDPGDAPAPVGHAFEILVDVPDPEEARRVAASVRDLSAMRFFVAAAERQWLGDRGSNQLLTALHLRTRDGIRTESADRG